MTPTDPTERSISRLKQAELLSSLGAGLAGAGLGAFAAPHLGNWALLVLAAGALLHAWGMYDKHHLEQDLERLAPRWSRILYLVCWFILAALAVMGPLCSR